MSFYQSTSTAAMESARVRTELEMRQSLERTNIATLDGMPKNTKKAYDPKIEEYRRWCDLKFPYEAAELRYIVNGDKAHYFLDDAVSSFCFV
jgi:hypothetical protein